MKNEDIAFFQQYKEKVAAYEIAFSTMYFDIATIAPKKGIPYRNKLMSILAGEAFEYQVDPENVSRLEAMYNDAEDGSELKEELRLYFRQIEKRNLPKELYINFTRTIAESNRAWLEAKKKNDYQIFKPNLIKIIEMQKEVLTYQDKTCSDYDFMLDHYQEGMNIKNYDRFFAKIKEELLPFIQRVLKEGKEINDDFLHGSFSIEKQAAYMEELNRYLNVNYDVCYMGTTEHPFTEFFSSNEARITTHYHEDNLISAILSTVHEYGHALYSLQVKEAYDGTAFKDGIGFAMHESQSRFLENHIGRSKAFWEVQLPILKGYFPQLQDVSLDDFVAAINKAKPSFIRTEADELTYPIHILIRYELEKEIFNGCVDYDKLDVMWNDKYEEYLGIRPENDRDGILQDMHWGAADLGYFPTYALGSAFAAQFHSAIQNDIDVEKALREHNFEEISNWLKEHIHQYGAAKSANQILEETTKEAFNPDYYIQYLKDKYTALYDL